MNYIGKVFSSEYIIGIVLVVAAVLAILIENSPLAHYYHDFLHMRIELVTPLLPLPNTLHHWVNDGLMVIFFLLVGIEIKREMVEGHLSHPSQVVLPGLAAVGGMFVPAVIFVLINQDNSQALSGWAIPAATDIAFAVGVLSLLGNRVPYPLKLFLLAVAIIDDMGAILIIALFYSTNLDTQMLMMALIPMAILIAMNWLGVYRRTPYMLVGLVLWYFIYHSGIHATIAGVLLAFCIPIRVKPEERKLTYFGFYMRDYYERESPAARLEYSLTGIVNFLILPLFAFTNSGVPLQDISMNMLFTGVPLGVIAGLFIGKSIGIFTSCWLMFKFRLATIPEGCTLHNYIGIAMLCGIGFTMSLFIVSLAYVGLDDLTNQARLGILVGSTISAIAGFTYLHTTLKKPTTA